MYLGKDLTNCEHGTCNSFSESAERRCRTGNPRPTWEQVWPWGGLPPAEQREAAGHCLPGPLVPSLKPAALAPSHPDPSPALLLCPILWGPGAGRKEVILRRAQT